MKSVPWPLQAAIENKLRSIAGRPHETLVFDFSYHIMKSYKQWCLNFGQPLYYETLVILFLSQAFKNEKTISSLQAAQKWASCQAWHLCYGVLTLAPKQTSEFQIPASQRLKITIQIFISNIFQISWFPFWSLVFVNDNSSNTFMKVMTFHTRLS